MKKYYKKYTTDSATIEVVEINGEGGSFPDNTILHYPQTWSTKEEWDGSQTNWYGYGCAAQDITGIDRYGYGLEVFPVSINLNKHSIEMVIGEEAETLTATVLPATATNKAVTWKSSNSNVATVTSAGCVTPKGKGVAQIYAYVGDPDTSDLYAVCQVTVYEGYTVSFLTGFEEETIVVSNIEPNTAMEMPEPTERDGYDFVGWFTKENGEGEEYTNSTAVTGDATVYAYYKAKEYTLTYDVNGGESLTETQKKITYDSAYGELLTPQRTGYTFSGWYTAKEGGELVTDQTICKGSATVYAHWEGIEYRLTYDVNGGDKLENTEKSVFYGKEYGELPVPIREGFSFVGWYTLRENGIKVTEHTICEGSATIYAVWMEESNSTTEVVVVKQKADLNAHFTGTYKKFTVDNKKLAAVSAKGILTAKQPGTVQVTGYEKNGKVWEAKETISVLIEKPLITEKTIIRTRPELTIDGSANITGAEKKPTTWISSKPAVATIDPETGLITTVGKGSTKITAVYGEGKLAAKYTFTVKVAYPAMSKKTSKLQTGATLALKLKNTKLVPEWTSSDPSVASVEAGKVTVHTIGTATITATVEGMGYTCVITVTEPTLSKKEVTLKAAGKTAKLAWKNTKLKGDSITWCSEDPTVATVDANGKITAIAAGTTNITSTVGGATGVCVVTVKGNGSSQGTGGSGGDTTKTHL